MYIVNQPVFSPSPSSQTGFMVLGALVLMCIAVPYILPIFIPLAFAFLHIQRLYVNTSREIKRLEATTRYLAALLAILFSISHAQLIMLS